MKKRNKWILGIFLIIISLTIYFAVREQAVTDDYRSLTFDLYQITTDYTADRKQVLNSHKTFNLGDFSITTKSLSSPTDTETLADIECRGTDCNDKITSTFTINNGLGKIEDVVLKAGDRYVINEWAYLTYTPYINTNIADPTQVYDASISEGATIVSSGGLFKGRSDDYELNDRGEVIIGSYTIKDFNNTPIISDGLVRDYSYHFTLYIKKGAMGIDKLQLSGNTANLNLNNHLWGGFEGRIVAVEKSFFSATNPISIFSSETKKINKGDNSFSIEVTPQMIGRNEVSLYPIMIGKEALINQLVSDDASTYNFESGNLNLVRGNLVDTEEATIIQLETTSSGSAFIQSNQTERQEVRQIVKKESTFEKFQNSSTTNKIITILILSLLLGLISIPISKKKKLRNYLISSGLIFVISLAIFFSVFNITLPENVESLQRDGWRVYEPLLYDGHAFLDGTSCPACYPDGATIEGLNCVTEQTQADDRSPTITETCTSLRFRISMEGRQAPYGYQFLKMGGGEIYGSGDGSGNNFEARAINIESQDISDFRVHSSRRLDYGSGTERWETGTTEMHYDFVTNSWCSSSNGGAFVCNPSIRNIEIGLGSSAGSGSGNQVRIDTIMYKSRYNCNPPSDSWLGYKVFTGRSLSLTDFPADVVSLCVEHPTTIFNTATRETRADQDVIKHILNSDVLRTRLDIPANEDWGVFFFFNGSKEGLSERCEEYYNFDEGACRTGQVLFASEEGVLDEEVGGFVTGGTQPEVTEELPLAQSNITQTGVSAPSGTQTQPSQAKNTTILGTIKQATTEPKEFIKNNQILGFILFILILIGIIFLLLKFTSKKKKRKKRG